MSIQLFCEISYARHIKYKSQSYLTVLNLCLISGNIILDTTHTSNMSLLSWGLIITKWDLFCCVPENERKLDTLGWNHSRHLHGETHIALLTTYQVRNACCWSFCRCYCHRICADHKRGPPLHSWESSTSTCHLRSQRIIMLWSCWQYCDAD